MNFIKAPGFDKTAICFDKMAGLDKTAIGFDKIATGLDLKNGHFQVQILPSCAK